MTRYPDEGLKYGVELLDQCFQNVPQSVTKAVHMCCGYPMYLVC